MCILIDLRIDMHTDGCCMVTVDSVSTASS